MMLEAHWIVLQVVLPMLAAPIIALLRVPGMAWAAASVTSVMAFAIAICLTGTVLQGEVISYELGGWAAPYGIELSLGAFGALLLLITTGGSSFALLAGRVSINASVEADRQPAFYAVWLVALTGMSGIAVAGDAFNIFVFMEITSLATYALLASGSDRRGLPAAFKYLLIGTVGATFYLIGVGLIYMMTGTLNFMDMAVRIQEVEAIRPILVAAGFITVGLAIKAALFPLHAWLPNSYSYAPHIVTAFLATCSTKIALYILLKFDFIIFQPNLAEHEFHFSGFFMPLAVMASLIASAVAIYERNIKRLLAYSSIAQIGYILLGASFVTHAGLQAGILHIFNHALAKGALFLAVACLATRFASLRIEDMGGAARAMPWTMAAFVAAGLSLIGIPGTAGFISKWYLISAAFAEGMLGKALVISILISSLMAVIYIWRVVEATYFGDQAKGEKSAEAPLWMLMVTWGAVLLNFYFGLEPSLPLALSAEAASSLLEPVK